MENWKDIRVPYEVMDLLLKIDEKKARLDLYRPFSSPVVHSIKESLTLEWTYNSNSIEGNTLTLQETRMVLEDGLTVSGKSLNEYFEAVNHHEAIDYVENLVQPDYVFRERDILNVHELVMDRIDKEFAGRIRNAGVRISGANFVPPNARKVSDFIEELITWVNEEDLDMHPVIKATIFHHRFVWIHPFFDGNGRTARLVFNLLFLKEGYPPAIILKVDRKKYYTALNDANNGNLEKLFFLVGRAVMRSLDIYLSNLDDTAGDYAPISKIVNEPSISYSQEYVSLLARQGKIDAYKEGRVWYTTEKAVTDYISNRKRKRKLD
ncbi:Fic family protein [Nonlabens sp.]|uniref:Fic family protein n=1 Tax=Nonlabens sp. TaxID=1888209 RepID=UPI0032641184